MTQLRFVASIGALASMVMLAAACGASSSPATGGETEEDAGGDNGGGGRGGNGSGIVRLGDGGGLTDAGGGDGSPGDLDASTDAGADAGPDVATDAGSDAATDAGQDAGADAQVDSGADASADSGSDAGELCGNGTVDDGEMCDGQICCNATCDGALGAGTVCRAAAGACDAAETCDGTSFTCPADLLAPSTMVCRPAANACDPAETCSGSVMCPADTAPRPLTALGSAIGRAVATGSTATSANDYALACATGGTGGAPDVAFSWTAPDTGTFTFYTEGSAYDTALELRAANCSTVAQCDDDGGNGTFSRIDYAATAGEQLIVIVSGYASLSGAFQLNIGGPTCDGPVTDIGSALGPAVATGTTVGGTDQFRFSPACNDAAGNPDAAFSWIAPFAGTFTFDTMGSTLDTMIGLVPDSCDGLIACNDDAMNPPSLQSRLERPLVIGERVYIVVTGYMSLSDAYQLNITPPNTCPTAVVSLGSAVGSAVATGTTVGAANSYTLACGETSAPDAVFTWTAPADGDYVFDTEGSDYDTALELRGPDCETISACSDDVASGTGWSSIVFPAARGELFHILISGWQTESGNYQLNITQAP